LLKDKIKQNAKPKTEKLRIEQWGVTIWIKELSLSELLVFRQTETSDEDETEAIIKAVSYAVCDEKGQQILLDEEEWLRTQPASVLRTIAETSLILSGATASLVEAQVKN